MSTHIVSFQAENVKRLRAVEITPEGNLVVIGGNNAQGKTSVLDAIAMAIGGKNEVPAAPIRNGETKARVVLDLGDLKVTRTFTASGGGTLKIEKDGVAVASPQALLDSLTGKVTFDPLAFIRMESAQRMTTIRRLVGLDFTELDKQRATTFSERTIINRDVDRLRTVHASMPTYPGAPAEEQSAQAVIDEITKAKQHNDRGTFLLSDVKVRQERVSRGMHTVEGLRADAKDVEEQISRLQVKLREIQGRISSGEQYIADEKKAHEVSSAEYQAFKSIDLTPLETKLAVIDETNKNVRANVAKSQALANVRQQEKKADELTKAIEAIDADKERQLKAAKFPIDGLSFSDAGVIYNGVPFEQASAAEQMRVSVAVAAALNPALRVMLIRDGSLLDDNGLRLLGQLAKEHNLQVWLERVGKGTECSVVIEDGAVESVAAKIPAEAVAS